jgi:hypothetical protein
METDKARALRCIEVMNKRMSQRTDAEWQEVAMYTQSPDELAQLFLDALGVLEEIVTMADTEAVINKAKTYLSTVNGQGGTLDG